VETTGDTTIGCGCVNLGSASSTTSWRDQVRLVCDAVDAGVVVFDTADIYGSGSSERILGEALRGRRERVRISTKGGYLFRQRSAYEQRARRAVATVRRRLDRPRSSTSTGAGAGASSGGSGSGGAYGAQDFSAARLRTALDDSLRRLRTDHVDVYQLHGPPEVIEGLFDELDDLRTSGKVGRFGIGAETIRSAADWMQHSEMLQLPFGVLDPAAASIVTRAVECGVEVWARGVLGGGLLSAAMRDPGSVAAHPKQATIAGLLRIAGEAGVGVDELAIRWISAQPGVSTMLVGISSIGHLQRNVELAGAPPLPAEVQSAVDALVVGDAAGGST
jgi:aryl-alcohol dehydrogenase-like predicted oxidoreductase